LIVTSILVGLTFVISVTIFGFGTQIQKSAIESNTYNLKELGLVKFSAYYKDADCTPEDGNHCYRVLIRNNENFQMKFVVRTNSPSGSSTEGPDNIVLNAYEQKVFNINYPTQLGEENIYAEIDPVVKLEEN